MRHDCAGIGALARPRNDFARTPNAVLQILRSGRRRQLLQHCCAGVAVRRETGVKLPGAQRPARARANDAVNWPGIITAIGKGLLQRLALVK